MGKRNVLLVLTARNQQEKDNWIRELNNVLNSQNENTAQQSGGTLPPLAVVGLVLIVGCRGWRWFVQ